jgi:hypothetical protein
MVNIVIVLPLTFNSTIPVVSSCSKVPVVGDTAYISKRLLAPEVLMEQTQSMDIHGYYRRRSGSNVLFPRLARPRRQPGRKSKTRTIKPREF